MRDDLLAALQGHTAGLLHEAWRTRGVVLDQLAKIVHQCSRHLQPAQSPACHQEGFGKAVGRHHPLIGFGEIEERRRARGLARRRVVHQPLIDIVGHQPDAVLATVRKHLLLLLARDHPASRIVRRIQQQCAGTGYQCIEQLVKVELPARSITRIFELQRYRHHVGTKYARDLEQVRPQWRDGDHPISRVHQ